MTAAWSKDKQKQIRRKIRNRKLRETRDGYFFVFPYVIGVVAFFLMPLAFSLWISLGDYSLMQGGFKVEWAGLKHFNAAIMTNIEFTTNFANTVKDAAIKTPLVVVFSLIIAIVLDKQKRGSFIFKIIFFLPFLLGSGNVMRQLLGMDVAGGSISMARGVLLPDELMGYVGPGIYNVAATFLDNITLVLWRTGIPVILFLSALENIPKSLYEAGTVDGASEWEKFWKITLPMISHIMLLTIVYCIIESFTDPSNPMVDMFYNYAFVGLKYSLSAAMSWIYFAFILILVLIVFAVMKPFMHSDFE